MGSNQTDPPPDEPATQRGSEEPAPDATKRPLELVIDPQSIDITPRSISAQSTEPQPRTPAVLESPPIESGPKERSSRTSAARRMGEDTLLSLPAPADSEDPMVVERLAEFERRLDQIDA